MLLKSILKAEELEEKVHERVRAQGREKATRVSASHLYYASPLLSNVSCDPALLASVHENLSSIRPLHPIYVLRPHERLGIDLVGPFTETVLGNLYNVTATDYCTKFA
ncbi:hypothetical protein BT69DRAFT_1270646 [Atractiella rhizophila]|nr:hypothetical protein BT69DRAFT_1270646 [Atractiella rhizophila]